MELKIYDVDGDEQDWTWLTANFGDVRISDVDGMAWRVSKIQEVIGPSALVATLTTLDGTPIRGIKVAWYWPDADFDPNAGPATGLPPGVIPNRCVYGTTEASGAIGFGMGGGAYYWPPPLEAPPGKATVGPHALWIYGTGTRSQVVTGLGMIGGTTHRHLDFWFIECEDGEPPEPPPPPPPPPPPERYTLAVSVQPAGSGTVKRTPSDSDYEAGTVVQLRAGAATGWVFVFWDGDLQGNDNPESITMNADRTVIAVFEESPEPPPPEFDPLPEGWAGLGQRLDAIIALLRDVV